MRSFVAVVIFAVSGSACSRSEAAPTAAPPAPPPAALPAPSGKAALLVTLPAWDVAPIANRLAVIDADFTSISAVDARTGKRAWREVVQKEARGRHTLLIDGPRLLAWFGDHIHVLDGTSGKRSTSYEAPMNGAEWRTGGCWVDVREGVCAERCQCSFALTDCATGAKRSSVYQSTYIEEFEPGGGMSSGCWGGSGDLIGKAGGIALITVEDSKRGGGGKRSAPTITAGIELASGRELWRLAIRPSSVAESSGHSPDGKTCWFSALSEGLTVVDCATGKRLWTTPKPGPGRHLAGFVAGRGIFELRGTTASLRAARTGKPLWSQSLPAGTLAWTKGSDQPVDYDLRDVTQVAILDPATGKPLATVPIPTGSDLVLDHAGGFLLSAATEVVAYDASGAAVARTPISHAKLTLADTLAVAMLPTEVLVLARGDLHLIARIPGGATVAHVEGALGPSRLALYTYDGKILGKIRLYAIGL